jgi:probable HAF family extracellular repeat protein
MMARNPSDRYQTPGEVAKALEPHAANEGQALTKTAAMPVRAVRHPAKLRDAGSVTNQTMGPSQPEMVPQQHEHVTAFSGLVHPHPSYRRPTRKRNVPLFLTGAAGALVLVVVGAIIALRSSSADDDKPATSSPVAKGKTSPDRGKGIKPITKPPHDASAKVDTKTDTKQREDSDPSNIDLGLYTLTDLGNLPGYEASYATAINSSGHVLVGYNKKGGDSYISYAFVYDGKTFTDIGSLGGLHGTTAYGINDAGYVVGQSESKDKQDHAFLYDGKRMKDLGTLGGDFSRATAINKQGHVVGFSRVTNGDTHECH